MQDVKGFEFPYNKGGNHWISIRCVFANNEKYPNGMVLSIDHMTDFEDKESKEIRIKFSKLMGVYYDVLKKGTGYCGVHDLRCNQSSNTPQEFIMKKKDYWSSLPQMFVDNSMKGNQQDFYNCGVISCFNSTNFIRGNLSFLDQEQIEEQKCNMWREGFCMVLRKFSQYAHLNHDTERDNNTSRHKLSVEQKDNMPSSFEKKTETNLVTDKVIGKFFESRESFMKLGKADDTPKKRKHISSNALTNERETIQTHSNSLNEKRNKKQNKRTCQKMVNAISMVGNKSASTIGITSLMGPTMTQRNLISQLIDVLRRRLDLSIFEDEESFKENEMNNFETFYIIDHEREFAPTPGTKCDQTVFGERSIMSVAMVEFTEFGNPQYRHTKVIKDNKLYTRKKVSGYKYTTEAIILHYIATHEQFEKFGYASRLLKWIADSFKDQTVFVYAIIPEQIYKSSVKSSTNIEKKINTNDDIEFDQESYNGIKYLKQLGFEEDANEDNYNLSVIDIDEKHHVPFTSSGNKIFRTTTTKLRNINDSIVYDTAQCCKVDKHFVTKLLYTKKIDETNYTRSEVLNRVKTTMYTTEDKKEKKGKKITNEKSIMESAFDNKIHVEDNIVSEKKEKSDCKTSSLHGNEKEGTTVEGDIDSGILVKNKESKQKGMKIKQYKKKNSDDMVFYGYNPHFQWLLFDEEQMETIDESIVKQCKEKVNTVITIPGGYRKSFNKVHSIYEEPNFLPRIEHQFRLTSRNSHSMGTCQWMAAAMLVNLHDKKDALRMMEFVNDSPEKVNWKYLFKGKDSLSSMLPQVTKYELVKMRQCVSNYIPFLMKAKEGMFVCILTDNNYGQNHVVGIDCESYPKQIWDTSETHSLELTQANLDRCTGIDNVCIKIKFIGRIMRKNTCDRSREKKEKLSISCT